MPEWVVVLVLFVMLRQVLGRGRTCAPRRHERIERSGTSVGSRPVAGPRTAAPLPPPDPVSALQKAWVEGRITDEAYEAGLDRVYRRGI